jgi:hypothetical protein
MTAIWRLRLATVLLLSGCAMMPTPSNPATAASAHSRVIVEVSPAPGLPRAAGIAQAQDAVIASLPPGRAQVVRRYATLPLLALEIDPALIDGLRRNATVVKVSPDETRPPPDE